MEWSLRNNRLAQSHQKASQVREKDELHSRDVPDLVVATLHCLLEPYSRLSRANFFNILMDALDFANQLTEWIY